MSLLTLLANRCGKAMGGVAIMVGLTAFLTSVAMGQEPRKVEAEVGQEEVRLVAMLKEDERGQNLRFPTNVATDVDAEETYVINGGRSNVVIYGADFFPYLVLGAGRGIDSPQCVFFGRGDGRVFVGQGATEAKPSRLTILNGAFLPEREVTFTEMPEAEEFSVINGVVGAKGNIYLVGEQARGVLVLTPDGTFSHWLKPLDKVHLAPVTTDDSSEKRRAYLFKMRDGELPPDAVVDEVVAPEEESLRPEGLPDSLMPKARNTIPRDGSKGQALHPVIVRGIAIDSDGRIFILSEEMSKVYVYGPGENLIVSFGEKGGSPGKMSRPRGIGLDEAKKCLYVVDYMRHTILVFDFAGRFIFEFGGRGEAPLWFNFPTALAVARDGRLVVADLFNNRVQVLETEFSMDYPVFGNTKGVAKKKNEMDEEK